MTSHPRRVLPGSHPHLGFLLSSCSWAERFTDSEMTRRLQASGSRHRKEKRHSCTEGPEDFVLEAPVEFPEAILQVPEMSPWQLGPSFG